MRSIQIRRAVSWLLMVAMIFTMVPISAIAEEGGHASEIATTETNASAETQNVEENASPANAWNGTELYKFSEGRLVPCNPITGEVEPGQVRGESGFIAQNILYKDIFGAHASDMNGNLIKAGGSFDSWKYGDGQWWPSSSTEISATGQYVCITQMYSNDGPTCRINETAISIPIRPSQESGYSDDVGGYGNYTIRSTGLPLYKKEVLKSKQIPAYTAAQWNEINLIYAVAKGMGGMTTSGTSGRPVNISAAATTLIMNEIFGFIGVGKNGTFCGKPIATNSTAVNTEMANILAWCNVYSKAKGLPATINDSTDTVTAFRNLGYSVNDTNGYYVKSGLASPESMGYFEITKSQSSGNQIFVYAQNIVTFDNKMKVKLKKTTNGNQSVLDCIKGNNLYTLQGAVYEIHQGSATGTVVETLTTNANGEASCSKEFAVGTVLYAVEKTAPSGYLLNSTPVPLTVKSDAAQNVFNVKDDPTFDPNVLKLKKTGTSSEKIQGAIFKVDYYASNWMDEKQLKRTWYFKSDEDGDVIFNEGHLASGYQSDPLYKPNGISATFPLGCVYVQEIKAASGYITPTGNDAGVLMFIRQGGTKESQSGKPAGAYWGNGSADPLNAAKPKGIYKIENDANKATLTGVNAPAGTAELNKIADNGDVEGYCFKLYQWIANKSWYGKSDDAGKIYVTDSNYNAATGEKTYVFNDLTDGTYTMLEVLSRHGKDIVWPENIRVTVENDGQIVFDKTYDNMTQDENGDCRLDRFEVTGLNNAGKMTITVKNKPETSDVEIIKTSPDGNIEGISFKVEEQVDGKWTSLGTFKTNTAGKIVENLPIGTVLRITEEIPDGYICLSENPQTITVTTTSNRVSFENQPVAPVEIVKTSTDGKIDGISFKVEEQDEKTGEWNTKGTYVTDKNGKIDMGMLYVGTMFRFTEIVPDDYVCLSENPQIVKIQKGNNIINFRNRPIPVISTAASSKDTGKKIMPYGSTAAKILDKVTVKRTVKGQNYYAVSFFKLAKSGEPILDETGKRIEIKSDVFTATGDEQTVNCNLTLDISKLEAGTVITVCQELYSVEGETAELVATHEDPADTQQQLTVGPVPRIGTTATWQDGSKVALSVDVAKVLERAEIIGLHGDNYIMVTKLMDIDRQIMFMEKTSDPFSLVVDQQYIFETEFEIPTDAQIPENMVVFEYLYQDSVDDGHLILTHDNWEDQAQTVKVVTVDLQTTATNAEIGGKDLAPIEKAQIRDEVSISFSGEIDDADETYVLTGQLMVKARENGQTVSQPLQINGQPVIVDLEFTREELEFVKSMDFEFNGQQLAGKDTVVFETLKRKSDGKVIASHANINSDTQTVHIKNPTGHTTATVDATESHYTYITPEVEITDRYFYSDLLPGEHKVIGYPKRIIVSSDGQITEETVMVNGKPMEVPVTFTVEEGASEGYVDIHFVIPGTELQGTKIVFGEDLYYKESLIHHHYDVNDEDQTVYPVKPGMRTTATVSRQHISYSVGLVTMQDVVKLSNILPGTYRCEGQIMVKATENGQTVAKPLMVNDKPVTATQKITVEDKDGKPQTITVIMTFDGFSAELVRGMETVVYEKLFKIENDKETEIATHENPNDEDQTVKFTEFKFRTVATVGGQHRVKAIGIVSPEDEVIYQNAVPGTTLIASATLMERVVKNGKAELVPFLVDKKPIYSETQATVSTANGTIIVKFPAFDVTKLAGKKLVVVEEVFTLDSTGQRVKLGEEHNADNKDQTIEFYDAPSPPSPKTGDPANWIFLMLIVLAILGTIVSATMLLRSRKQRG